VNFDLSAEQQQFSETVARFAGPVDTEQRRALRRLDKGYDRTRWTALADLGLIALAAPEAAGGLGGSLIDLVVIAEAMGTAIAPDPWLESGFLTAGLLSAGRADDRLPPLLDGSQFWAFAFAERGQRYTLLPRSVTAVRTGDSYVLTGEKTFVPSGIMADMLIVSALCEGEPGLFCVPAQATGVHRRGYTVVDGSHAAVLTLHAVAVPASARLSLSAADFDVVIDEARLLCAAEIVGLAQTLFTQTIDYVKQREQFGVPIGSFQAVQHRLVDCYAALEQARSMLWRVALADRTDSARWSAQVAGAKFIIGQNAMQIGTEAVQFHGGMGITDELAMGHAFKRLLLLDKLLGDGTATLSQYAKAA
jgi:alkylation response protein AidB-like acyl-CoA dehydrogenase